MLLAKLKEYWWVGVIGLAILIAMVFSPSAATVEELKALLRKKRVEDDVNKLNEMLQVPQENRAEAEKNIVELAEKLKSDKKNLNQMSTEEVQDFYRRMLQ